MDNRKVFIKGNKMDTIKGFFVSVISAIAAYLNPISGEMQSLLGIFAINFVCGLLTALIANDEHFSFKKAWQAIVQATIFFVLICAIYFIGERKGNQDGALQCVSFVTYAVIYFYACNILRNLKTLLPNGSVAYRAASFLYYVVSVEFVKKIPFLADWCTINKVEKEIRKEAENG